MEKRAQARGEKRKKGRTFYEEKRGHVSGSNREDWKNAEAISMAVELGGGLESESDGLIAGACQGRGVPTTSKGD